jgi:hypothetical protein
VKIIRIILSICYSSLKFLGNFLKIKFYLITTADCLLIQAMKNFQRRICSSMSDRNEYQAKFLSSVPSKRNKESLYKATVRNSFGQYFTHL